MKKPILHFENKKFKENKSWKQKRKKNNFMRSII